ncbi:hypothetical protein ANN_11620 [Periplaneta americana]|uniref:Uncharacterized protein n=1 Tax=Periplaneta americana TaxID=6978 RepID=A0ABQ8T5I9_PERAM|nr:hypothetical protein ANN_11620 [Periplaneta americana]
MAGLGEGGNELPGSLKAIGGIGGTVAGSGTSIIVAGGGTVGIAVVGSTGGIVGICIVVGGGTGDIVGGFISDIAFGFTGVGSGGIATGSVTGGGIGGSLTGVGTGDILTGVGTGDILTGVGTERIPNLTGEQSDGITVFRIPPMTSLILHRCRTGAINLQRWWQAPSAAISESDWF